MYRDVFELDVQKGISRVDITNKLKEIVKKSKIKEGLCIIFVIGKECGLLLTKNDYMLFYDFRKFFERIKNDFYFSKDAESYLRSSILPKSISIPVVNNDLLLEEDTSVYLIEFGSKKKRKIIVTIEC